MIDHGNRAGFAREVARDLRDLRARPASRTGGAPYAGAACPPELPVGRERERLERVEREARRARGERSRERQARERTRPWSERDRFGLRKRVWREQGERGRALVDLREQVLLERERDLAAWLAHQRRWLRDLAALDPASRDWCAAQARRVAEDTGNLAHLAETHRRWREAATARARALLAREEVRRRLAPLIAPAGRDAGAIAPLIAPALAALARESGAADPPRPAVVAAVALGLAGR